MPSRKAWARSRFVEEVRHADRLRAHRAGQRENPPGSATRSANSTSPSASPSPARQVPGIKDRDADTAVEMMAGQTLAIAGLVQTVSRRKTRAALDQRSARIWARRSAMSKRPQRSRTADPGHAGVGRGDGRQRSAAVRAGHGDHQPERLGIVHERPSGSAELLSERRRVSGCRHAGRARRTAAGWHDARPGRADLPPRSQPIATGQSAPGIQRGRILPQAELDAASGAGSHNAPPGLVGPVGYDVVK